MTKRNRRRESQPRIPGIRRAFRGLGMHPDTEEHILDLADQYNVSPSWVLNFYLEHALYGDSDVSERVVDFTTLPAKPSTRTRRKR